jgi:hypothetical protein
MARAALLAGLAALAGAQEAPPDVGERCTGCKCGKTDLSPYRHRTFRTPADDDGYRYMFKMCEDITNAELPEGCQAASGIPPLPHPAVVKFKDNNVLDCEMVGSFGPCENGDITCGMTYQPHPNGLAVTWQYLYGCQNTFRIFLSEGSQDEPREAPYNDPNDPYACYWITHWPSLSAFGHIPTPKPGHGGDEGSHWFADLILWVFVLFVAYLVIGTAIGVKVQGKPLNIEAVPHIHVWRQVGEMAGSGVAMARAKVNGRAAASSQYKGVDGAETSSLKGEVVDYGAADKGDYDTL